MKYDTRLRCSWVAKGANLCIHLGTRVQWLPVAYKPRRAAFGNALDLDGPTQHVPWLNGTIIVAGEGVQVERDFSPSLILFLCHFVHNMQVDPVVIFPTTNPTCNHKILQYSLLNKNRFPFIECHLIMKNTNFSWAWV